MSKSTELDKTVKLYILDCIDGTDHDVETNTTEQKIKHLKDRFESEYGWAIEHTGPQQAMIDWLQGLALNIEFMNYKILELAKSWGSIPQDANDKQEDKILDNYWNFMAAKILQLFNGYRVPA